MVRLSLRNKSISTKVTEEEFGRLEELAMGSGQSMGEWAREVLLGQLNPKEEIILAEILALRNILVNLAHAQNQGETLTEQDIQELMAEADAIKRRTAAERLEARRNGGESNEISRAE